MGVRNGFGRRWLYRAGARAHVGGPTPPGHPVFAARRVLPCPATHARQTLVRRCVRSVRRKLLRRAYVRALGGAPAAEERGLLR